MQQPTIKILIFIYLLFAIVHFSDVNAQNGTNSPFSMLGIGEIEYRDFSRTAGMGGIGIGYQSENYINRRNPAGLSSIDTLRFVFDVSAAMKFSEFSTKTNSYSTNIFSFKTLAAGVRISKWWTSSVGLSPYSNVGYRIKDQQLINGTKDSFVDFYFSGQGGLNKFYWANAVELFKGFSLGVASSFVFGNINHNEEDNVFSKQTNYNVNKIMFDFGMQYSHWFGEYTNITVGGIYTNKSKFNIQRTKTISTSTTIEMNQRLPDIKLFMPESYGAGFSILRNKKNIEWVFGADYQTNNWSVNTFSHKRLSYTDCHIYNAGLQITPNTKRPDNYFQVIRYQLGVCYNQSYLNVKGYQLEDYSASLGFGLPFRNSSYVNICFTVGESLTGEKGGITERYYLLSLNLSLIDRWLPKYQWN